MVLAGRQPALAWFLHKPKKRCFHSGAMSVLRLSFSVPFLLPSGLFFPTELGSSSAYTQVQAKYDWGEEVSKEWILLYFSK